MPTYRQDDGHPSPAAVSAVGLRKSYGDKTVLDGINLRIPAGSVFALLGPNGAGKTTAVKILSTLITADAGDLHVGGHDLATDAQAVRAAIGVTGQFLGRRRPPATAARTCDRRAACRDAARRSARPSMAVRPVVPMPWRVRSPQEHKQSCLLLRQMTGPLPADLRHPPQVPTRGHEGAAPASRPLPRDIPGISTHAVGRSRGSRDRAPDPLSLTRVPAVPQSMLCRASLRVNNSLESPGAPRATPW
ncbi:ATP-binding cassette domain-containing protein [Streptomyces sp. NPDC088182]|uniref:ATP-binding cassette domain-containing protein n=1 Tax=Streptomyces sp. NPDC088182 TaxID=3365838 RepID=UPI003814843F